MTYIRCPDCGQKALSVATQCPKCGYVLTQNPMQSGGERGLVRCRDCHKMIPRGVAECPYCGYTGSNVIWQVLGVAAAIVVVAGAGFGVWWLIGGGGGEPPVVERPRTPPSATPTGPGAAAPADSVTPDTSGVRPPAEDLVPSADSDTRPAVQRPAADTDADVAPIVSPAPLEDLPAQPVVRWTDNWVNVREGPGIGYSVVRILRPGVRLEVGRAERGWWPVYQAGEIVGYVAGSELTAEPPDTTGA